MNKDQLRVTETDMSGKLLAGIMVFKVLLSLFAVSWLAEAYPSLYKIDHFPDGYDKIAMNLIEGNGYRLYSYASETMQRLPGFVFVLAGIFYVFGKSLFAVQCFNLLCGLATALVVRATGRRFLKLGWQADLAAALYLLYPGTLLAESRAGVESLFTFLIIGFIYLLYQALESNKLSDYLLAGAVLGISTIIKSTTLVMPFFLVALLFYYKARSHGIVHVLKASICLALPMALIVTPWAVRNHLLTGEIVVTQTNLGTTAYQGMAVNDKAFTNSDHATVIRDATLELNTIADDLGLDLVRYDFFQHFGNAKDEVLLDRYLAASIKQQYLDSPALLVKNTNLNFLRFWYQGRTTKSTILNTLLVTPCLVLVCIGLYRGFRANLTLLPIAYFSAIFIAGHLPILTTARYHVTLVPLLALLAALTWLPRSDAAGDQPGPAGRSQA